MTTNIIKTKNGRENVPAASFSGLVDRIFQDNLDRFFNEDLMGPGGFSKSAVPVNVRETGTSYEMDLVAPGLRKENFKLNVADDTLTVSFEHNEENNQEDSNWLRKEYRMQSFTRSFSLDETVDADKISAKYADGILHLVLPKKENARKISRSIDIH